MPGNNFRGAIGRRIRRIFLFKEIRIAYGLMRYGFHRHLMRNFRSWNQEGAHLGKDTLKHNSKNVFHSIFKHERVHHIVRPLLAIEDINHRLPSLKVLSVGPRSEAELLLYAAYGFTWKNLRGLDLVSYSPMIDVGDMHDMPYEDNSFDVIFVGWVLSYSEDRGRALKEMVRVLKPQGYIAFGNGYDSSSKNGVVQGNYVGASTRPNDLEGFLAPIKHHIDTMFFRHDITPEMMNKGQRAILGVFSIKK